MSSISDFFLRAKHWLIFLLLLGSIVCGQVAIVIYAAAGPLSPEEMFSARFTLVMLLSTLLAAAPLFSWLWAAGSLLSDLQERRLQLNLKFFRFAVAFPMPYMCLFFFVFQSSHPEAFLVIFPLHLFAVFCIFYSMYFVSKNLSQVEVGRRATFSDYAGYFFLIWLYPVGIWVIQPKINRLYLSRHRPA